MASRVDDSTKSLPSRRDFVRLTVVGGAALWWLPGCADPSRNEQLAPPTMPELPRYFTADERATLSALADYVMPPDDQPGGAALGGVEYIEQLLTAMETDPPRLYAGGPFSDRNPAPLPDGRPSTVHGDNDFLKFLPLTREQTLFWRLRLYGSDAVPGGGPNDALFGKIVGWRQLCQQGLAQALQLAGKPLDQLEYDELDAVWHQLPADFIGFVSQRVVEAAFGAPEYGGNKNLAGWQMIHFEGDTLPYGFANYDDAADRYVERPDAPLSTPNRGPDPDPIDTETDILLKLAVSVLDGRTAP